MVSGGAMSLWLLMHKLLSGHDVADEHGPLFMIAAVQILGGIQMMGIGLLGELQVRHFHLESGEGAEGIKATEDEIVSLASWLGAAVEAAVRTFIAAYQV